MKRKEGCCHRRYFQLPKLCVFQSYGFRVLVIMRFLAKHQTYHNLLHHRPHRYRNRPECHYCCRSRLSLKPSTSHLEPDTAQQALPMPGHAMVCFTILFSAILCCSILFYSEQVLLSTTLLYYIMVHCTIILQEMLEMCITALGLYVCCVYVYTHMCLSLPLSLS